jgi:5-methylcytosine-specific restriction endonuclease McrA
MNFDRKRYEDHIRSEKWAIKRAFALNRAGKACEKCGYMFGLQVHHKHYRNLGDEKPEDLEVLCLDCHKIADIKRQVESSQSAAWSLFYARLDGWATKKYGEDWEDRHDAEEIEEEFQEWLEQRDDYS